MKLEFKKATREDWITALVVILMIAIPLGVSIFIRSAKPQTMIGEEGFSSVGAVIGATYPEKLRGLLIKRALCIITNTVGFF
jgi:hypothetical protein